MLRVFAAGSLRPAFETLTSASFVYDNARELAARIEAGEAADVFCSASPVHPARLHALGLARAPVPFATNRLVIAVPRETGVFDLFDARMAIEVYPMVRAVYVAAVVSEHPDAAAFVDALIDHPALLRAGFGPASP